MDSKRNIVKQVLLGLSCSAALSIAMAAAPGQTVEASESVTEPKITETSTAPDVLQDDQEDVESSDEDTQEPKEQDNETEASVNPDGVPAGDDDGDVPPEDTEGGENEEGVSGDEVNTPDTEVTDGPVEEVKETSESEPTETGEATDPLEAAGEEDDSDQDPDTETTGDTPEAAAVVQTADENQEAMELASVETQQEEAQQVELSDSTVYMTNGVSDLTETVKIGSSNPSGMTWTIDGEAGELFNDGPLSLSAFREYVMSTGEFTGDQYITVNGIQNGEDYTVTIDMGLLFGEDLSLRTPNNIRKTYRDFIGEFVLTGKSADGSLTISKLINLRPYENYHSYEEMEDEIERILEEAPEDRLVDSVQIGTSEKYSHPIQMGIIAKDQESIDKYLYETTPVMLNNPDELLEKLQAGTLDYKVPVMFHNTHADEQPGIDIVLGLYEQFALSDLFTYNTQDADGNIVAVEIDVSEVLEHLILLFTFTQNPDGMVDNTRVYPNGYDPNRDASYQTNPETEAVIEQINKWNPIALVDFHGFVRDFLIEPATPPHDPNFEYDLFSDTTLQHAHEMGRAGIANSKYDSYFIPKLGWEETGYTGWDDAFSGYTGVYALYQGILGHTVEIPETNQDSYNAGFYGGLGSVSYVFNNLDQLMERKLQFFSRGINKIEDPRAEEELVGADGEQKGRPTGENPSFFPDYYVIPMAPSSTNASDAAFALIEYFRRNGVNVSELTEDHGDFKQGDLVIDMAQAKRNYANHVLYPGSNESEWDAMYAELLVNLPGLRGFDAEALFDSDGLFDGILGEVTHTEAPRTTDVNEEAPYYFIANNSISAVQAVNDAIREGANVYRTENGFIVETNEFQRLIEDYALYGEAVYEEPVGEALQSFKVYSPNSFEGWVGQELPAGASIVASSLGFQIVDNADDADVIILDHGQYDAELLGKKPTIIIGGAALRTLERLGVLPGFDAETAGSSYEGLFRANLDEDNPLASGYYEFDTFYSTSGTWIEGVPEDFDQLMAIADEDFYISGWWPGNENMGGKLVAIDGLYGDFPMFIYAGNPLNRQHSHYFYRWVSNAIFRGENYEEPADSWTPPGQEPGEPGEEPGEPGEEPGEPGEPGEEPGEPGETPGEPGEEPGDPGETPGEPGETPGEPGEEPGEPGEEPGEPGEEPGEPAEDSDLDLEDLDETEVDKAGVLPQTGHEAGSTFMLGAFFVTIGSYLFKFKRKEE